MRRRQFLSSLVAAASALVGASVGARALPQQAPIPSDEFNLNNVDKALGEFGGVPWKVETRSITLNEEWMARMGEQVRDTMETNVYRRLVAYQFGPSRQLRLI